MMTFLRRVRWFSLSVTAKELGEVKEEEGWEEGEKEKEGEEEEEEQKDEDEE